MKRLLSLLIILLFIGMSISSSTNALNNVKPSNRKILRIYVFGIVEDVYISNHTYHFEAGNFISIRHEITEHGSRFFWYTHHKNGFGLHISGWSIQFRGILKPHFVCGYLYHNHSEVSHVENKNDLHDSFGLGLYFSREFFIGKIKNITIEGNNYDIYALNLCRISVWWNNGSRGFQIEHARDDTCYRRFDYAFRGIIKPNFICGIGRYI